MLRSDGRCKGDDFDGVGLLEIFFRYGSCCYSTCLRVVRSVQLFSGGVTGLTIVSLALLLPPPLLALTPYFSI